MAVFTRRNPLTWGLWHWIPSSCREGSALPHHPQSSYWKDCTGCQRPTFSRILCLCTDSRWPSQSRVPNILWGIYILGQWYPSTWPYPNLRRSQRPFDCRWMLGEKCMWRAEQQLLAGVYQPSRSNCCKRHHATETKHVADLRQPEVEMHALSQDIRQESFQIMCTQGHHYQNNGFDVRSSVIINRLPTPVANKEETYGIGNQLVAYGFAKYDDWLSGVK